MKRTIILLFDSFGIGEASDAKAYGDVGSNTLGHIADNYPEIKLTNLSELGLINSLESSCGSTHNLKKPTTIKGLWGVGVETSKGKDTPSGHWELMGSPVDFEWGYFRNPTNPFPEELLQKIYTKSNIQNSIGNCIGSGTEIINNYGELHLKTNSPIFYTSADSVFQIAASEETFGLENLYTLCKIAREELYQYNIGRVIARPFVGNNKSTFKRTTNRVDYSIKPNYETLLDVMKNNNGEVIAIGKVSDIFAEQGITKKIKSASLENLFNDTLKAIKESSGQYTIIFTNFVDLDSEYGHRRDIKGYKEALEYLDQRLPEILSLLHEDDLLVITADHGNDPSFKGNDHTREHIPILFYSKLLKTKNIGIRETFADVGQSIADYMQLPALKFGKSFL